MPDVHSVAVGVWIKAGSRDEEDGLTGVAHFLEHMAFKGTATRDAAQIAREVEDVGGFMNAHTSREETAYYINLLPEHMELGVDILSDILTASTLPSHEIERERGVIIRKLVSHWTHLMIWCLSCLTKPVLASIRLASRSWARRKPYPLSGKLTSPDL